MADSLFSPWFTLLLDAAVLLVAGAIALATYRLWRGPTTTDRLLALDTLYTNAVALLLLFDLKWYPPLLFEAALMIAALGFVGTVAAARFLSRRAVVE